MNEEKILNEEKFQKTKKKIKRISIIVLFLGIIIGGSLITLGIIKSNDVKKQNEIKLKEVKEKISDLDTQISDMSLEISKLENEKQQIFSNEHGFTDNYYAKDNEITSIQSKKAKLQNELIDLQREKFRIENPSSDESLLFYGLGGFIIFTTLMISLMLYLTSKRREILAYNVQGVMPIAQEGIENITPTVASSAGEIAKEIKNGIDDNQN